MKSYSVNNKQVQCPSYIEKYENDHKRVLSKEEKVCDILNSASSEAYHNLSRMKKLNDEYKCSPFYAGEELDGFSVGDCGNDVYSTLTSKLYSATSAVANVNRLLSEKTINTWQVKELNNKAIDALEDLHQFTLQHKDEVNVAFEKAFYDTNAMGVLGGLAFMFMPAVGVPAAVANHLYNNEFDGKISRAYEDAVQINDKLDELNIETSSCLSLDYSY
jgi:hypothetical protein